MASTRASAAAIRAVTRAVIRAVTRAVIRVAIRAVIRVAITADLAMRMAAIRMDLAGDLLLSRLYRSVRTRSVNRLVSSSGRITSHSGERILTITPAATIG